MRVLIDLQACQSPSGRVRGVGRYCLALSQAMAREARGHEIWIAVNGAMPASVANLRDLFAGILPDERIVVWESVGPTASMDAANDSRTGVAEYLREEFIEAFGADVVLTMSMIDGYADSVVTSVREGSSALQVAIVFDLIPLLMPDIYLSREGVFDWYARKLDHLRRCDLLLGISEFTSREAAELLGVDASRVVNISAAVGPEFHRINNACVSSVGRKYGIVRPFVMYAGGFDPRKNLARLINAYAMLPADIRDAHQLVFTGGIGSVEREALDGVRAAAGLSPDHLVFTGFVSDEELVRLYNACALYAFPSTHEGFGLPALEAMSCGAVVVGSNTTSLPEVIGAPEALFSPYELGAISHKLFQGLTDQVFRESMKEHALEQVKRFSWDISADTAWRAIEAAHANPPRPLERLSPRIEGSHRVAILVSADAISGGILAAYRGHKAKVFTNATDSDTALPEGWVLQPLSAFTPAPFDEVVVDALGIAGTVPLLKAVRDCHASIHIGDGGFAGLGPELAAADPRLLARMLYGWGGYAALTRLKDAAGLAATPLEAVAFGSPLWEPWRAGTTPHRSLSQRVADVVELPGVAAWPSNDLGQLASALAGNMGRPERLRTLFVDISNLVMTDAKTGIQRVVRHVLAELLANPPAGFRIEPIYVVAHEVFRYARTFTLERFHPGVVLPDDPPVEFRHGDIFLGLDLAAHLIPAHRDAFVYMRSRGVTVHFVVYDLLPLLRPDCFDDIHLPIFRAWYEAIAELGDGVIAISRTVADELKAWLDQSMPSRDRPLKLGWFHLGADLLPALEDGRKSASNLPAAMGDRPTFLMVGTIEPRKGHAQTLAAFEELWRRGHDVNLVVIGKPGWRTDALAGQLRRHPETGRRLFWMEKADDGQLVAMYRRASALIAASEGEGFGLPLIEAAQYGLSIIARDLPVFREVAGEHATYFSGLDANGLADVVDAWLGRMSDGSNPVSHGLPWVTWSEAAAQLMRVVVDGNWYDRWLPTGRRHFAATDYRAESSSGSLSRGYRMTDGSPGLLYSSVAFPLRQGDYAITVRGWRGPASGNAWLDVVAHDGCWRVASSELAGEGADGTLAALPLELREDVRDIRFRVMVDTGTELTFESVEIVPATM